MTNTPARILVVDDEKLIRWSVAERLQRDGYEVISAESGEKALELVAASPPDVMLLDVKLPGIDGVATLERAQVARRNLPSRVAQPGEVVELRVPVPDREGALAEVTTLAAELGVNIADLEIAHSSEGDRGVLILLVPTTGAQAFRAGLVDRGYRPALRALG